MQAIQRDYLDGAIALNQLRAARAGGIKADVVLADAGYGNDTDFRDGITEIWLIP